MSKMWLRYLPPSSLIGERWGVLVRYEIHAPELGNRELGHVEKYLDGDVARWRTMDHKLSDWTSGFSSREAAAQDLVTRCPRTVALVEHLRERLSVPAEKKLDSPEIQT